MKYTFTKYTINIPEIITYFAYIYSLIALAILIKPTRALYLIMLSLCIIATILHLLLVTSFLLIENKYF